MKTSEKEKEILKFWKKEKIFEKGLQKSKKNPKFIFYEGPPGANGRPGLHHVLSRSYKDIICRYKAMKGFYVERRAGWDTHGLPVELEVEKQLQIKTKQDIEKLGIDKFVENCKNLVWRYKTEWEKMTEEIGFWLDFDNAYITYDPLYIESLWYTIKEIYKKGLLYEDEKIVPWCPRCQTSLSSHEVSLGYQKVKDPAIYIKLKLKNKDSKGNKFNTQQNQSEARNKNKIFNNHSKSNIYFLAWTTTPWTLPGNMALAVNSRIDYVLMENEGEQFILAKERIKYLFKDESKFHIIKEFKGKDLVGLEYEPLYQTPNLDFQTPNQSKIYYVVAGDFVSTDEGTGIVHIAPAFGEDDMAVWRQQNSNLKFSIFKPVDEQGKMKTPGYKWDKLFVKDADPLIIGDLKNRNLLLKEELYEHEYPFCWRCKNPLLYYLHSSWFFATEKIKEKLIKNNQKVNWVPPFIKEGRFGKWLEEIQDWNFSRERYWGTPLPIWKCNNCNNIEVIGSREDIRKQKFSTNRYFILRHGLAQQNVKGILSSSLQNKFHLTNIGKLEVKKSVLKLKKLLGKEKLDIIFSSDIQRCKETSEIVSRELGTKVIFSSKLRELNFGEYDGSTVEKYRNDFPFSILRFEKRLPKGESWNDCKLRMLKFINNVEKKYQNKNILIVSHGDPLWLLESVMKGLNNEEILKSRDKIMMSKGELREIEMKKFPYNKKGELDFHRPFVDEIEFYCPNCKRKKMQRVKEVGDVWFDSGAMPFAQNYWPFSQPKNKKSKPPELFPANFICEGIDQTRGWFYTLLAVSSLLGFSTPYKNVLVLGLVLDKKGKKMSKSKGNAVFPEEMINKYGADAIRFYFFTVNQPWEGKRFDEKDLRKTYNRFILTVENLLNFLLLYTKKSKASSTEIKNILDRWILSKMENLKKDVDQLLSNYDVVKAARLIENFVVDDLSNWYLRRSRERLKKGDRGTIFTFNYVLLNLSLLLAPFTPFLSEEIYQKVKGFNFERKKSVHLENFPQVKKEFLNKNLEEKMNEVKEIVALGLAERKKSGIKVRQPIASLKIKNQISSFATTRRDAQRILFFSRLGRSFNGRREESSLRPSKIKNNEGLLNLIKDELNVKEVIFDSNINGKVELDTKITPELKNEGILREILHQIQEMRKSAKLKPKDKIQIIYDFPKDFAVIFKKNEELIKNFTLAKEITTTKKPPYLIERQLNEDGKVFWLAIKKV